MRMGIKCPICKEGELYIYREVVSSQYIPLTKRNTPSKRKIDNIRHETHEVNYLRCRDCPRSFDYETNDSGQVIETTIEEWDYDTFK